MRIVKSSAFSILLIISGFLSACNSYQQVLKSPDINLKYEKAEEYFKNKEYQKALTLLENIYPSYLGTSRSENISYYLAYSYYQLGQYELAAYQFRNFADAFPLSQFTEEAYFLYAYSMFLQSPPTDLDQVSTRNAISAFQLYLNLYPENSRVTEINGYIDQLTLKLENKAIDNAMLYYKIQDYKAAVWALKNIVNEYPATKQKEKLEFLVVRSSFLLAENSVPEKKLERYKSTMQYYSDFSEKYPDSKYKSEADKIAKEVSNHITRLNIK